MLSENLKKLRTAKGLSQEELALKLNVVRQTVSKWEKGLSVPDSEMLIRIAEELDTSVNVLLGEAVVSGEESELKAIAAKLELLNEQFAKKNESRRKLWRVFFILLGVIALIPLLLSLAVFCYALFPMTPTHADIGIIGGSDGPTSIFVTSSSVHPAAVIAAIVAVIAAIIGIWKTRRK